MLIKRELYLKRIRNPINSEDIKIITGIHRSGKICIVTLDTMKLPTENIIHKNLIEFLVDDEI